MVDACALLPTPATTVRHVLQDSKPNKHRYMMQEMESLTQFVRSTEKEWIELHVTIMVIQSTLMPTLGRMFNVGVMSFTLANIVTIVRTHSWLTQTVLRALVVLFMILSKFTSS